MSPVFNWFLAGQLDLFRPATLCFAPFVNSYKRFQPDSFAGSTCTWGIDNRTVTLRVINASEGSCRVENRSGGADLNPYAAFACCLGTGLRGLHRQLALPPRNEGNAYKLEQVETVPTSLKEACDLAAASSELKGIFAPGFIDNLVRIGAFEAASCEMRVSDIERRRYFEMV